MIGVVSVPRESGEVIRQMPEFFLRVSSLFRDCLHLHEFFVIIKGYARLALAGMTVNIGVADLPV